MATATIHICDVCGYEDKKQTEFKLKVYTSGGEVAREMDLCIVCNENLGFWNGNKFDVLKICVVDHKKSPFLYTDGQRTKFHGLQSIFI